MKERPNQMPAMPTINQIVALFFSSLICSA
jgi:hypothetical protein